LSERFVFNTTKIVQVYIWIANQMINRFKGCTLIDQVYGNTH